MQSRLLTVLATLCIATTVAGAGDLDSAIRPISNFVYLDSPDVGTSVHPIFVYHEFPSKVNTTLGDVKLGGDLYLYALQF